MSKKIKLQKGAIPVSLTRSVGAWLKMEFDAKLERNGITWLRAKGGFGGGGDREDWVADLPHGCCSVSDYNWNDDEFGLFKYPTFEKALDGELKRELSNAKLEVKKCFSNYKKAKQSVKLLEAAIKPQR